MAALDYGGLDESDRSRLADVFNHVLVDDHLKFGEDLKKVKRAYGGSETWSKWMDSLQAINGAVIAAAFIGLGLSSDVIGSSSSSSSTSTPTESISPTERVSNHLLGAQLFSGSLAFLFAFFGILASVAASRIIASINYILGPGEDYNKKELIDLTDPKATRLLNARVARHGATDGNDLSPLEKAMLYKQKMQWRSFKRSMRWVQGLRHASQVLTGLGFISLSVTVVLIVNQRLTPQHILAKILDAIFIVALPIGTWMIYIPNQIVMGGRSCNAGCCPLPRCCPHPYHCTRVMCSRLSCMPLAYDDETDRQMAAFAMDIDPDLV